jgi:twitching motility protein PilT
MDQRDRLFADIAARLELLTREQIATCARLSDSAQKRLGDVAIELGFINDDEAQLIRAQETRALERLRPAAAPRTPSTLSGGAREERTAARIDPRSASSPAPAKAAPPAPAKAAPPPAPQAPISAKRGTVRAWQAPDQVAQGQIHVPRQSAAPPRGDAQPRREPASAPQAPAAQAAPRRRDGDTARLRAAQPSIDVFPLAEGADVAPVSAPLEAPAAAAPAAPAASRWSDGTLANTGTLIGTSPFASQLGAATTQPVEPAPAAAAPTPAAAPNKTLMQPFAAPAAAPAPAPQPAAAPPAHVAPVVHAAPAADAASPSAPPLKAAAQRPATATTPAESYLGRALALAIRHGASDLHAHSGAPLIMRVDGALRPLANDTPLNPEAAEKIIADITTDAQWAQLAQKGEVDFACEIPGLARFRVNVYRQHRGIDAVFRIIPLKPPTLAELGLPERLSRLTDYRTGMVLCTGPAGCGKSSTLAALLGSLVQSRADHILTIENPVEFVLPGGKALINQRQVIDHTTSFSRALRAALREDPDIIAITELRDRETMSLAISAAETGHLVLGTLHTGSAAQTIQRIISSFPADEQEQVRTMVAESLRAVVSQRLVPMASGKGRAVALELLMVNHAVGTLIREDKTFQIPSILQTGRAAGMIMLDDSLDDLVKAGTVTKEAAQRFAVRKERFN